jgi:hypothetical protein
VKIIFSVRLGTHGFTAEERNEVASMPVRISDGGKDEFRYAELKPMDDLTFKTNPISEDDLRAKLRERYDELKSWRKVASEEYEGIPSGTLCAIANGYPVPYKRRAELGLSPMVRVEVCPICGLAHTHAHGQDVYDPTTHHVTKNRNPKPRAPRIAIRKDDMQSAAKTIWNNLPLSDVRYLAMLLMAEIEIDERLKEQA